jgi:predicted nucleotidyltransferase
VSTFLSPLDHVLTSRGKVRLLRALMPLSRPVSGREAAKLARLSQTPALRALDDMVALGVLRRAETSSQHLYEVNRKHQLVREGLEPLFRAERERIGRVLEELRMVLADDADRIASAVIFGSAARSQDRPGSDFDVLVLVREPSDVEQVHDRIADSVSTWRGNSGWMSRPWCFPSPASARCTEPATRWRRM